MEGSVQSECSSGARRSSRWPAIRRVPETPDVRSAYDRYYESGFYDHRYPGPNPRTLTTVVREVEARGARVLDFGCGSGRYAAPLALRPGTRVVAYDICATALSLLRRRHARLIRERKLLPVQGDLDALGAAVDEMEGVDVALLAFGVLAHIRGADARRATLETIARLVRPGGSLIVGLPNIRRRFRREQRETPGRESGDVTYTRVSPDGALRLFYHLYDRPEVERELAGAGLRLLRVTAESVLPERTVASRPAAARLDAVLSAVAPLRLAYGFLALAERPPARP